MVERRGVWLAQYIMEKKVLAIFSFTEAGSRQNTALCEILSGQGVFCVGYAPARYAAGGGLETLPEDLDRWIGERWGRQDFLFIGAAGIAVRCIAPWVRDKYTDSAVLVMDEGGDYIIPLLSGHVGGAVELSQKIGQAVGAKPVITTATDVKKKFAVDVFAHRNDLLIGNRELAKAVSASVLDGQEVGFCSDYPWEGTLPPELTPCAGVEELRKSRKPGVMVTARREQKSCPEERILFLSPKKIVAGIGCRRGIPGEELERGLSQVLEEQGFYIEQLCALASIDLKKEEPGIVWLARKLQIPFYTYTAGELAQVESASEGSLFVQQVTGVDNVCERAALLCSPEGRMLLPKRKCSGMTVALVEQPIMLRF